ncbi:heme-dependent catalase [Lophiostoma macrostomum CBS 122681]|uniref:catalase n=1 Tax=Lophiostoma macrostomum CBS 122681 TaxID=1314788 RepID=A0A6A6SXA6_9PLEO|nr:heme-dependent catalase [Lophiostoma macrostomum CBS 122681]
MKVLPSVLFLALATAQNEAASKLSQILEATVNTEGQIETDSSGVRVNTSDSLRAEPRGYVLLEDTAVRKRLIHFDRERQPERVVHALGTGAYGSCERGLYQVLSRLGKSRWLSVSEGYPRVCHENLQPVWKSGPCGALKTLAPRRSLILQGNHIPSFFINDGAQFPDLIHAVKAEPNKGFPTDGSAHTTAYDFFTEHPEAAFQTLNVLSDLGLPRDARHLPGNGIHTYKFLNAQGKSMLFKWYWMPVLGLRSLVYDEAQILAGKNPDLFTVDLYNNIEAGVYPEWEFAVQLFPDDGSYMWQGYDLLVPTEIVPFEVNPPVKLGKLTLNRNYQDFFAEEEQIAFAPSNVVDGFTFVPDPLLQWRLMSYDEYVVCPLPKPFVNQVSTSPHRHGSPNAYQIPINRPIAPVNNDYRGGFMQTSIFVGESASTPDDLGGVVAASPAQVYPYGSDTVSGEIGRYLPSNTIAALQARQFWQSLDQYGQQHLVDGCRFELGNVANTSVVQRYIDIILNPIDNCLARRVAFGLGAVLPPLSGAPASTNKSTQYPSLYPLDSQGPRNKSNAGLSVAVLASDSMFSKADLNALMPLLVDQQINLAVVASRMGTLQTGVTATQSCITASSVFYDAIFVGSPVSNAKGLDEYSTDFLMQAYNHGKPIGIFGDGGSQLTMSMRLGGLNSSIGLFGGSASATAEDVLNALSFPTRFFNRFPVDEVATIC